MQGYEDTADVRAFACAEFLLKGDHEVVKRVRPNALGIDPMHPTL